MTRSAIYCLSIRAPMHLISSSQAGKARALWCNSSGGALAAPAVHNLFGRTTTTHCVYNTTSLVVIPSTSKNLTPCAPGAGGHWAPSHVFACIRTKYAKIWMCWKKLLVQIARTPRHLNWPRKIYYWNITGNSFCNICSQDTPNRGEICKYLR